MHFEDSDFPALFKASDTASLDAQRFYFFALQLYLLLLILAAFISFYWPKNVYAAIASAVFFLFTLGILLWLKLNKPEDTWYNGRAVAESVKTRTWRWVMKADPYDRDMPEDQIQKELLNDLKAILSQNRSLSGSLHWVPDLGQAISEKMISVRNMPWEQRLAIYKSDRIDNQLNWYSKKSLLNKRRAKQWFFASVILHSLAVIMLLYRIKEPTSSLPIEVVATTASAVLTWLQAKKHNELNSSYALTAHEIVLVNSESATVKNETHLSEFVINSESAFSREHTQWTARKIQ